MKCFMERFNAPDFPSGEMRPFEYYFEALREHFATMLSWDAMRYHLKDFPNAKQRLPTKERLWFQKMYFISRAYMECHASNTPSWDGWLRRPPGFHRINRIFSNSQVFMRSFECKRGDNMVGEPRCKIFQDELDWDVTLEDNRRDSRAVRGKSQ